MKTRSSSFTSARARQTGAALVIGLILLVVLTLLAVSGMNTANTELKMAGNEQFRRRAFEVSEAGIERSLALGPFNPGAPPVTVANVVADAANPDDLYTLLITSAGPGPAPGFSFNKISAEHFTVQSLGQSMRSGNATAVATHLQGLFLIVPMLDSTN
ncbi:MAG TPA: PilX N-terminal domain-containing pilus assembly protein [Steroidobacteraceae bacterium]|nr:PilX N-terminal domain-containing pilus assembly protein [Steroidobacteraceae bacterium]